MTIRSVRGHWPWLLFVSLVAGGLIVITSAYRVSQTVVPNAPGDELLSDRQKLLLASEGEMSKWLLGLASGALAAVAGLRLKEANSQDVVSVLPMVSYAFLVLSLYGAFLSYAAAIDILRRGPLNYSYGAQLALPVLVQFWTLILGLSFLGVWLFKRKTVAPAIVTLALLSLLSMPAHAQEADLPNCTAHWYNDRLKISPPISGMAVSVLKQLERHPGGKPITNCTDADSVLDRIRLASTQANDADPSATLESYLGALNEEMGHPDLGTSEVVIAIIKIMSPWDKPLGVLSVHSSKYTYNILLDTKIEGITNWSRRLEPGTYRLRVIRHYDSAYSNNALTISADETKDIDLDKLTQ
jgi:hypothetical protein